MPPDDMDSTTIAVGERVRIDDKVASAVLNAASGSGPAESGDDNAQDTGTRSDAEVGFQFSTGAICPLCSRTLQMKLGSTYDGRSSTSSPPHSGARPNESEP